MLEKTLANLNFSPSEVRIYIHLLKKGSSYANRISSEIKINRTNVYEALDRLVNKGAVSYIKKNNLKWFEANSIETIFTILKEKEEELNTIKKKLANDIKNFKFEQESKLEANIFVGKKGLRIIFEEILEIKRSISLIASELQFKKFFGPYFELWHRNRIKKNIKQRSIFPKKLRSKVKERKLLEYKFIENKYTNPTTTLIYGNNCLFVQWTKEPIAIKIENSEIAKSHQNYFDLLWKN